jgi:hypothetical protein
MSDFLAEVDEAMRQERIAKFWHENKTFIITFILLTILATGASSAYRSWDTNTKTEQTKTLIALQGADDYPSNIIDAELNIRPSLRGIALLSAAGTFVETDKPQEALKLYSRLAADSKIPEEYRYLGILMKARLTLSTGQDVQTQDILASLYPVLENDSPWKSHAQIDAAILEAEANTPKALELLNAVQDTPNLPQTLYERAEKLHHIFSENLSENDSVKTN